MIKVILLSLMLTACSMNPIDMMKSVISSDKPSIAVDTEIVVGDKVQETEVNMGETTMTADIINNVQDTSPWVLFLLVLGWFLPTPTGMFRMAKEFRKK